MEKQDNDKAENGQTWKIVNISKGRGERGQQNKQIKDMLRRP